MEEKKRRKIRNKAGEIHRKPEIIIPKFKEGVLLSAKPELNGGTKEEI